MAFFKKKILVGVSVTPEKGLEVAQIDFLSKRILKYASRPLVYDNNRKEIADFDIFKETLSDLLIELNIPKGSEIVLNLPTITFGVSDYPASLSLNEVNSVIEDELLKFPIFEQNEPSISTVILPNSTIQFNKVAYTAAQKAMIIEIVLQIKDLGYKLIAVDTSVNSTLNALIYNERVDVQQETSWTLLLVDNNYCRVIPMQGRNYVECFEERISIGEVLGDAENYSTVINAVDPILKNVPSQYLYVVSKTNVISAKLLADKLVYNSRIIHQEDNKYSNESYLEISELVDESVANSISLDVIGAAIQREFVPYSNAPINLFNAYLGDIYTNEQPPILKLGRFSYTMSIENMIMAALAIAIPIAVISVIAVAILIGQINMKQNELNKINKDINIIEKFLEDNKNISSSLFDEADEIRMGIIANKSVYSYYTIVGTEIPQKLWLTSLKLGTYTTIEGQADNLESVYSFFRSIKDYTPDSKIKLQKLALANNSNISALNDSGNLDTNSIITSMNADFYEFRISDDPNAGKNDNNNKKSVKSKNKGKNSGLPDLEPLE